MLPRRHPVPSRDCALQPFLGVALLRSQRPGVDTIDRARACEREIGMPLPRKPILGNARGMVPGPALAAKPVAVDGAGGQHDMDVGVFPSVGRGRCMDGEVGDHSFATNVC